MKSLLFHPAAAEELQSAVEYYDRQFPGLGSELVRELEQAIDRIREFPQIGSRYKHTQFRQLILRRYPYQVFYREFPAAIWVIAVAHAKRRPGYWRARRVDRSGEGPVP